jgi:hypothetical protein
MLERINHGDLPGRDFLLIDLRRNDHVVGRVYTSHNPILRLDLKHVGR